MAQKCKKILLVEDDQSWRELTSNFLSNEGYEVFTTWCGETGIEKALNIQPDLILIDIQLPGITGIEAIQILRKKGYTKPIAAWSELINIKPGEIINTGCDYVFKEKLFFNEHFIETIHNLSRQTM